jgi:hypothetical protein
MSRYVTLPDCTAPETFGTKLLGMATAILDEVRGSDRLPLEAKRLLILGDALLAEARIQARAEGWNASSDVARITLPTGGNLSEMVL